MDRNALMFSDRTKRDNITSFSMMNSLTCHNKLSKGHPLQQRAEQLAGGIFEAEEQTDSLAVVEFCQAPMLLPQVFIPHLSHN